MKKNILLALYLLTILLVLLSSCNSDNKKTNKEMVPNRDTISKKETVSKKDSVSNRAGVLEGVWVSIDDSKSELEIKGNKWIENYTGEKTDTTKFAIGDSCMSNINDKANPNGRYITVFDGKINRCFSILDLNDSKLTISYVDRGNTLSYKKKK
jgi:hypothetical protein